MRAYYCATVQQYHHTHGAVLLYCFSHGDGVVTVKLNLTDGQPRRSALLLVLLRQVLHQSMREFAQWHCLSARVLRVVPQHTTAVCLLCQR